MAVNRNAQNAPDRQLYAFSKSNGVTRSQCDCLLMNGFGQLSTESDPGELERRPKAHWSNRELGLTVRGRGAQTAPRQSNHLSKVLRPQRPWFL